MRCLRFQGDTLSKVSDFLYRGRGPKELLNPILREENGCVYALDRTGYGAGRMLKIPIDSTDFVDDLSCWEEEDLTWSNPMNMGGGDFLFLSDGNMLLTGDSSMYNRKVYLCGFMRAVELSGEI